MTVRAKFRVQSKTEFEGGSHKVTLVPVYSGSEENKRFYKATPGGNIELQVVSTDVAGQFETGSEYYVDFSPAEKGSP